MEGRGLIIRCNRLTCTVIKDDGKLLRTIYNTVSQTEEIFSKEVTINLLNKTKIHAEGLIQK